MRGQQGTAPGDGGSATARTAGCHLNSDEQPVAVATAFLRIPVICSPRSYLTPASAVGPQVVPLGDGGLETGRGTRPGGQRGPRRGLCASCVGR